MELIVGLIFVGMVLAVMAGGPIGAIPQQYVVVETLRRPHDTQRVVVRHLRLSGVLHQRRVSEENL